MLYQNLTAQQLLKLIKPIKTEMRVTVDHNPFGEGGKQTLSAYTDKDGDLDTQGLKEYKFDGVDYGHDFAWTDGTYTGTFGLETTPWQNIKPEVYAVGDTVMILENARECGGYKKWGSQKVSMIGRKTCRIEKVGDNDSGLYYGIKDFTSGYVYNFASYCIQKIANPETITITITINGKEYLSTPELEAVLSRLEEKE